MSRRVGNVTGTTAPVIVGSQSLYALTDDVPDAVKRSIECDFLIVGAGREAFRTVTEEFGLASEFQVERGYYADALGLATVVLPTGWQERLVPLAGDDGMIYAYCTEVHDTAVSKLIAGREKGYAFLKELFDRRLASIDTFAQRAAAIAQMPQRDALAPRLEALTRFFRDRSRGMISAP